MSAKTGNQETKLVRGRVVSVSVPPGKRVEFDEALVTLKHHHKDPFIQVAPLIVETVIEAAKRIEAQEQ